MRLPGIFEVISQKMKSDFEQSQNALSHAGLKGTANEEIFKEFLRKYLPKTIDVSGGLLFDSSGNHSKQVDVIISDTMNTPIFYQSRDTRVIPVECAYAVFEIKAHLDKTELLKAYQNMQSVKNLKKEATFRQRGAVQYTRNLYGKEWDIWPIHYFVFAFDSISLDSLTEQLIELQATEEVHMRIDSICVLNKGVVLNIQADGMFSALPTPNGKLLGYATGHSLLLFYTLFSVILNQAEMDRFNFLPYLNNLKF